MRYFGDIYRWLLIYLCLTFCLKCPTLNCCSRLVGYTVACYFSSRLNVLIEHLNALRLMTISLRSNYLALVCLAFDVCNFSLVLAYADQFVTPA